MKCDWYSLIYAYWTSPLLSLLNPHNLHSPVQTILVHSSHSYYNVWHSTASYTPISFLSKIAP